MARRFLMNIRTRHGGPGVRCPSLTYEGICLGCLNAARRRDGRPELVAGPIQASGMATAELEELAKAGWVGAYEPLDEMAPKNIWRVAQSQGEGLPHVLGVLGLCRNEVTCEWIAVFVRDGKAEKTTTPIDGQWAVSSDGEGVSTVHLVGKDGTKITYRVLQEIPITEGTERVVFTTTTATINPRAVAK